MSDELREAVRAYGSACANHQHDRNKPGGNDRRALMWERVEAALRAQKPSKPEGVFLCPECDGPGVYATPPAPVPAEAADE